MAFRILSENEIELLTEKQQINYEKELAVYNERVRFVEQLEKYENIVNAPYKPKLTSISTIEKIPNSEYSNPEYTIKKFYTTVRKAPDISIARLDESVKAAVPKCIKAKRVSVKYIKLKKEKPSIKKARKTIIPEKVFKKLQNNEPVLPEKSQIIIPEKKTKKKVQLKPVLPKIENMRSPIKYQFMPLSIKKGAVVAIKPNVSLPKLKIPNEIVIEKVLPVLPQPSVKFTEINIVKIPDEKSLLLPKAIIPNQLNISFKYENEIKAKLPEVTNISIIQASFIKPDIQKAVLPAAKKSIIPKSDFINIKYSVPKVPDIKEQKFDFKDYSKPEIEKSNVPVFIKPVISLVDYNKPTVDNVSKFQYSVINIVRVKPYVKINNTISNIPNISKVVVPDAYSDELIKNMLLIN